MRVADQGEAFDQALDFGALWLLKRVEAADDAVVVLGSIEEVVGLVVCLELQLRHSEGFGWPFVPMDLPQVLLNFSKGYVVMYLGEGVGE